MISLHESAPFQNHSFIENLWDSSKIIALFAVVSPVFLFLARYYKSKPIAQINPARVQQIPLKDFEPLRKAHRFAPIWFWDETSSYKYVSIGKIQGKYYAQVLLHQTQKPIFCKMNKLTQDLATLDPNQAFEAIKLAEPYLILGNGGTRIKEGTMKYAHQLTVKKLFDHQNYEIRIVQLAPDSPDYIFKVMDKWKKKVIKRTCLNKNTGTSPALINSFSLFHFGVTYFNDGPSAHGTDKQICSCSAEEGNRQPFDADFFNRTYAVSLTTRDGSYPITKDEWAVRVINNAANQGHAQIMVEGIDKEKYFVKVVDVIVADPPKSKIEALTHSDPAIFRCMDMTEKDIAYYGSTEARIVERIKVEKLFKNVEELREKSDPSKPEGRLYTPGQNLTLSGNYRNCLEWVDKFLSDAGIFGLLSHKEYEKKWVRLPSELIPKNKSGNKEEFRKLSDLQRIRVAQGYNWMHTARCIQCTKLL